jgi:hypothetical protein
MIATRKVIFEKKNTLLNAIMRSQEEKQITYEAYFLLQNLCYDYVVKNLKFAKKEAREDVYHGSLQLCLKYYDKFNPKHHYVVIGKEKEHCEAYFKTIIRHYLK